jgi:hypothetical protein
MNSTAIETNPLNELPCRLWTDLAVPGERMKTGRYAGWLSVHLAGPPSPLPPAAEAAYSAWQREDAVAAIRRLAAVCGHAHHGLLGLEKIFSGGMRYAGFLAAERAIWRQMGEADRLGRSFDEWALSEQAWSRLRGEWKVRQSIGNVPELPDVPFRPLLRRLLAKLPDQRSRAECLADYLFSFAEISGVPLSAQFLK